jgi:GT2 family glycosyltransferase
MSDTAFIHPTVGIVVPTLGRRRAWLRQAVASVEAQSFTALAIVAPPDTADRLGRDFPGRLIVEEARPGIVPAIRAGWRALSSCSVIGWLGDDDELVDGAVETALACLERADAAMVYGDCEYVDESGRRIVTLRPGRLAPAWLRVGQNFIAQPGCLYRRTAVTRVGGLKDDFRLAFDADLHRRLSVERAVYCRAVLARARAHATSLTTLERRASRAELADALSSRRPRRPSLRRPAEPFWRTLGRVYYRFHRRY